MTMNTIFAHMNINVTDLARSIAFYEEALSLQELRRIEKPDFTIVYMGMPQGAFELELTHLKNGPAHYELGDNETHLAVRVDDRDAAYALHSKMGCICYENHEMGLYFIHDPDDYWIEVLQKKNSE